MYIFYVFLYVHLQIAYKIPVPKGDVDDCIALCVVCSVESVMTCEWWWCSVVFSGSTFIL